MTNISTQNPWHGLPVEPFYVLPKDKLCIDSHRHGEELRLDALPDPFVGGLDSAEVVFLAMNPGFEEADITVSLKMPAFLEANYNNRNDPYTSPFYYFSGGFEMTGGYVWWTKKLKTLLQAGVTEASLRDKIMLIEYLPYHSINAKKIKNLKVPSQLFSFDLVREAMNANKTIVIMRSREFWFKSVRGLEGYQNLMIIKNPRNPAISPKNLGDENFSTILEKLS